MGGKYRILDESSNFSGQWSNDITPYLVGIMDAFNDPYIQEINFCKPTQVGGTEAMLNMLGWIIMDSPSPTMIVYPSDDLAKDTSNDRIKPSLTKTPEIKERFYEHSSKELNLKFRGMKIYLRGSGSPGKLASKSIKYLFSMKLTRWTVHRKRGIALQSGEGENQNIHIQQEDIHLLNTDAEDELCLADSRRCRRAEALFHAVSALRRVYHVRVQTDSFSERRRDDKRREGKRGRLCVSGVRM